MPLSMIQKHAAAKESGEIIVAGDDGLEVHVYLLDGRIAWATSSLAPNSLTTYLIETCNIDKAALREVVEECRRAGTRFADTLISWNVATPEQVRGALHAQIATAIGTLVGARTERSIFLPRQLDYGKELTFDVSEFAQLLSPTAKSAVPAATTAPARVAPPPIPKVGQPARAVLRVPPIPPIGRTQTPAPVAKPRVDYSALVNRIEIALPAALWVYPLHAAAEQEHDVVVPIQPLANAIAAHGGIAFTMSSNAGTILGHLAPESADWVLCGFPANANVVRANAALTRTVGAVETPAGLTPPPLAGIVAEDTSLADMLMPINAQMRQTNEMIAALVVRMQRPAYHGAVQRGGSLSAHGDLAVACVHHLPSSLSSFFAGAAADDETITVSIETGDQWHYGSVLSSASELFLWMVLTAATPRGAGRVLLKKLARQMSDDEPLSASGIFAAPTFDPPTDERRRPQTDDRWRPVPDERRRPPTAREEFSRREDSSVFDEARYEDEETSSVYQIAPSRDRGKPPRGGGSSGAFG